MGATNTTANYNLSQFVGTDKPAWLQDYNGDMLKIDTGINAAKVAADGAQNSADAAQNDATTANNAITNTINPTLTTLNTTVGNQGGAINTINSLIGNGTPTTTDQTIIGAINEINAKVNYDTPDIVVTTGATYGDRLNTLHSLIDKTKLTLKSKIKIGTEILSVDCIDTGTDYYRFNSVTSELTNMYFHSYVLQPNNNSFHLMFIASSGTVLDGTNDALNSNVKLYY